MRRLLRRTFRRVVMQEELWSGNQEAWQQTFSRDSLVLWALQTYRKKQKKYSLLIAQLEYAHLKVVHLRSPKTTHAWLANLTA